MIKDDSTQLTKFTLDPEPAIQAPLRTKLYTLLVAFIALFGGSPPSEAGTPPPNDNYANATVLSGEDLLISGITAEATLESGPGGISEILGPEFSYNPACLDGVDTHSMKSLWWRWRAPRTGVVFLFQPPYRHVNGLCSPTLSAWRARSLGTTFPFPPSPQPTIILNSGGYSLRYLYVPLATQEGEEFVFQMLGDTPETHSVRLLMHEGPLILEEPVGGAVQEGEGVVLHVVAAGTRPPPPLGSGEFQPGCHYQWWFNDHPIDGETYSALRIPRMSPDLVGSYRVVVSDDYGTYQSRAAEVSIRAQPAPPRLEVQIPSSHNSIEFTLLGEPGRIYQLEGSTNLLDWSAVRALPISGLEVETQYITGGNQTSRDKIAYNGVPFRFQVTGSAATAFVRARKWESSCDECMTQLWAVQFAKEDWGREQGRTGTDEVSGSDIFYEYASYKWLDSAGPTNSLCVPMPLILGTVSSVAYWPCPLWPGADGALVPIEEMPGGVWNGARAR